jgi:hypothetical protein
VADLRVEMPSVVSVLAPAPACDRLVAPDGVVSMRIGPREVLLVGADADAVRSALAEPGAIVDDVSDGWEAIVIEGEGARAAFARLSELALPAEGWLQGDVAKAPAKVIVGEGAWGARLTILVPAMLACHVEERVRSDAAEVLRT